MNRILSALLIAVLFLGCKSTPESSRQITMPTPAPVYSADPKGGILDLDTPLDIMITPHARVGIRAIPGAQLTVGVGSTGNDGTGDSLRTAFGKLNANDTELYGSVATINSGKMDNLNGKGTNATVFQTLQILGTNSVSTNVPLQIVGGLDQPLVSGGAEAAAEFYLPKDKAMWIKLRSGVNNVQKRYIAFMNKNGTNWDWLFGPNETNTFIRYDAQAGTHREFLRQGPPNDTGDSFYDSSGEGAVQINASPNGDANSGHGGLKVFGGGISPVEIMRVERTNGLTLLSTYNLGLGFLGANGRIEVNMRSADTTINSYNPTNSIALTQPDFTPNNMVQIAGRTYDSNFVAVTGTKIVSIFPNHTPGGVSGILSLITATNGTLQEKVRILENGSLSVGVLNGYDAPLVAGRTYVTPSIGGISSNTMAIIANDFDGTVNKSTSLSILSRSSGEDAINFGNETREKQGQIVFGHSSASAFNNSFGFLNNGVEQMRMGPNGQVGIQATNPIARLEVRTAQDIAETNSVFGSVLNRHNGFFIYTPATDGKTAYLFNNWSGSAPYVQLALRSDGSITNSGAITSGGAITSLAGITGTTISGDGSALTALNAGNLSSGTMLAGRMPALTGDITSSAGSVATTLKNTGTAGTYRSVTTDAQGRVTSGTNPGTFNGYGISDSSANLASVLTDKTGSGSAVFQTNANLSTPRLLGIPVYANNAAAVSGGLTTGNLYRTGADPDALCIVH